MNHTDCLNRSRSVLTRELLSPILDTTNTDIRKVRYDTCTDTNILCVNRVWLDIRCNETELGSGISGADRFNQSYNWRSFFFTFFLWTRHNYEEGNWSSVNSIRTIHNIPIMMLQCVEKYDFFTGIGQIWCFEWYFEIDPLKWRELLSHYLVKFDSDV